MWWEKLNDAQNISKKPKYHFVRLLTKYHKDEIKRVTSYKAWLLIQTNLFGSFWLIVHVQNSHKSSPRSVFDCCSNSLSGWCLVKSHASLLQFPHCETSSTLINTREPREFKALRHKLNTCYTKPDISEIYYKKLVDYRSNWRSYAFFPDHRKSLKMNPHCARCGKIVYATEKVNCLDKVYTYFRRL